MQALVPTLFPCYAAADRETAARIAAFLERGADIRIFLDEGQMRPGEDLAGKAREARMADTALVIFSRNSLPPRWPRSQWEGALIHEPAEEGVRIGFARCDDCGPPRILANQFDVTGMNLKGLRQLKRWVRQRAASYTPPDRDPCPGLEGDLEVLGIAIADRPGSETIESAEAAVEFTRAYAEDFDEIFVLETAGRSLAALAGDLGAQIGLRLEDELEANLYRLRDLCCEHRFLLVQAGPSVTELEFGGRCSTLYAPEPADPIQPPDPLRSAQLALSGADDAADWREVCHQARLARRLTREQGRFAECYDIMQQWRAAAEDRDDPVALQESSREIVWLLEGWGRTEEPSLHKYRRAAALEEQLALPFD